MYSRNRQRKTKFPKEGFVQVAHPKSLDKLKIIYQFAIMTLEYKIVARPGSTQASVLLNCDCKKRRLFCDWEILAATIKNDVVSCSSDVEMLRSRLTMASMKSGVAELDGAHPKSASTSGTQLRGPRSRMARLKMQAAIKTLLLCQTRCEMKARCSSLDNNERRASFRRMR